MKNALSGSCPWRLFGLLLALTLGTSRPAASQNNASFGFEFRPAAKVVQGTDTLRNAWAGGLNSPQFSNLDLNADQQPDLVVFDRITNRVLPFLSVATTTGRAWQFAPDYAALFPTDLNSWMVLRDYDCDGRPDLFTADASGSNIRVFRHEPDAQGRPAFRLVTSLLTYFDPGPLGGNINIAVGGYNMPAIEDVDGDGRPDVLSPEFGTTTPSIYYYRNISPANNCGALRFELASRAWGGVRICGDGCASFLFGDDQCRPAPARPTHTVGYNLGAFDVDGDGDLDLLSGRSNCPDLTVLRNDGTRALARFTAAGLNAPAPFNSQPARVPNQPAAYPVDVTFDGRPDLVIAPNLFDNRDNDDTVDTRQSVLLYRNVGPGLVREQPDFLQSGMLDLSEQAAPTFADLDADGLVDMLVGAVSRATTGGPYRAVLHYYRNVGTRLKPIFKLETDDYLGLSGRRLASVRPVLVDLNEDGRPDLVYAAFGLTSSVGTLTYVLNTAAAGQPAAFNLSAAGTLANLPTQRYAMPCFADIDGDGHPDLLLGVTGSSAAFPGGPLRYYRNTGTGNLAQRFVLQNNDFGQLRTSTDEMPSYLSPAVADFDGDGRPDLLTADAGGNVRFFADLRRQPTAFQGRTDLFFSTLSQQFEPARWGSSFYMRLVPAAADVNGDGVPELFLGQETGGISSFASRRSTVTATQPAAAVLALRVYPNPATAQLSVEAAQPVRLALLDLTGRLVRAETPDAARTHQLSVADLPAGLYLVRARSLNGATTVRRLQVQ